jgi:hypothetical protein
MSLQCMPVGRPRRQVQRLAQREDLQATELLSPFIGQVVVQIDSIRSVWRASRS